MSENDFVRKSELEAIKEMIHNMDKRQTLLERDVSNATISFQTILSKLENLPDKITEQVGQTIAAEIEKHKTNCRLENLNGINRPDNTVMGVVAKNLTNILLLLVLIAAAYLGVKVPF